MKKITQEDIFRLAYLDYMNKHGTLSPSQHNEWSTLGESYTNDYSNRDYYIMYYLMIQKGLSENEIFLMTLKERITYFYLFLSNKDDWWWNMIKENSREMTDEELLMLYDYTVGYNYLSTSEHRRFHELCYMFSKADASIVLLNQLRNNMIITLKNLNCSNDEILKMSIPERLTYIFLFGV